MKVNDGSQDIHDLVAAIVAQAIEAIDEYCRKAAGMPGLSSEQRWRYIRCSPGARWWNKMVGGWRC